MPFNKMMRRSTKKVTVGSLAKKVSKNTRALASKEKGRIRIVMDTTPDTTAVVQNLSFIAQGDDVDARHGRKIHAESISVSGISIKLAAGTSTRSRFIIFRDNLGTTTAPTLADLFSDEDDFFNGHHRLINEQPMKRFTILWDKYVIQNQAFDGQAPVARLKFFKRLNFNVIYTGVAATDEGKNSLWLISGSSEATNVPTVSGDIVFKYSDL